MKWKNGVNNLISFWKTKIGHGKEKSGHRKKGNPFDSEQGVQKQRMRLSIPKQWKEKQRAGYLQRKVQLQKSILVKDRGMIGIMAI